MILVLKGLVGASLILQVGLLFRSSGDFIERPIIEDAYYSLSVARSIAQGKGFSVDGSNPTNGVQPLICVLYAPVYLIFPDDPITPLRGVLLIDILIGLAGALLFGRLLVSMNRDAERLPESVVLWGGIAGYLVNYSLTTHLLNGLETGLSLVMLLAVALYWNSIARGSTPDRPRYGTAAVLGLLLGVAILVRIDAVLLALAVAALYLVNRVRASGRVDLQDVAWLGVAGFVAVLISSPWWIYNLAEFGHLLPVSGQSQADLSRDRWNVIAASVSVIFDALLPGVHTPTGWTLGPVFISGLILPVALALGWLIIPRFRDSLTRGIGYLRKSWEWRGGEIILVSALLYLLAYTFFFSAPHFQPRYLILMRVIGSLLLAIAFLTWVSHSRNIGRTISILTYSLFLALSVPLMTRHYVGLYSNIMLDPLQWVAERTGPSDRIGMFQSGTVGYFFPDRVVNLDGKVNVDAHRHFRDGTLGAYVARSKFAYIIDWPLYTDRIFRGTSSIRSGYRPIDTLDWSGMIVWERVGGNHEPEIPVE